MTATTAATTASPADDPVPPPADATAPARRRSSRTVDPDPASQAPTSVPRAIGARSLRAVGSPEPPAVPHPLEILPRTSTARPWDRVRFVGSAAAESYPCDDAAHDLAPVIPIAPSAPPEDPAQWCGSLVRAAVEALVGSRPAAQLARWLTADLYESLARRAGLAVRVKGRPVLVRQVVVRRVHLCRVGPTSAEAAVVVHDGERIRAAAVRVEAHRGRWRATAMEIG